MPHCALQGNIILLQMGLVDKNEEKTFYSDLLSSESKNTCLLLLVKRELTVGITFLFFFFVFPASGMIYGIDPLEQCLKRQFINDGRIFEQGSLDGS